MRNITAIKIILFVHYIVYVGHWELTHSWATMSNVR
jgi:hypothetical protein